MTGFKKVAILTALGVSLFAGTCSARWVSHQEVHTVVDGETLDDIAQHYVTSNCNLAEYREGIVEVNYDQVFGPRGERRVVAGDVLTIYHWVDE